MTPEDLPADVKTTLMELRKKGCKLAIGSSSKNTKMILERIGLNNFFDAVSDGTNIVNSKPDPEVFLKAAELIGENPKDCLIIEDAKAGIEGAFRGGFDSAGLGEANEHPRVNYKMKKITDLLSI